ncbi:MAG: hypothetical protein F4132_12935 [Gemmatimonadetes bacterium]|nr:hypothetical protein [Gemmatimonadota bacterium]MYH19998.1 hypothetical protein [Gemmatimonadota bacterium]
MPNKNNTPQNVTIHILKSNQFRVVHSDGAWGGLTPQGLLSIGFFSERHPIPQEVEYRLYPNGKLSDEQNRKGKTGIVRELEVNVVMSIDNARSLVSWIQSHIEKVDKNAQ